MLRRKAVQDGKGGHEEFYLKGKIKKEVKKEWRKVRREERRKAFKKLFENNERCFRAISVWKLIHAKYIKLANKRNEVITVFIEDN